MRELEGELDTLATPCHSETMALNFLSAAQVASFPLKETDIALITASVLRA